MACGGFTCSRNSLVALNIFYIVVAITLISVASYVQSLNAITSIGVIGGIIGCGVFLLLIAIIGIIGAAKHHQVLLFFYMVILFLLFVVQFSLACACLAVNEQQQHSIAQNGWNLASYKIKAKVQKKFECCHFDTSNETVASPPCTDIPSCCPNKTDCHCPPCYEKLRSMIAYGLDISGGFGLIFSFTEVFGMVVTYRYRHMMDGTQPL